VGCTCLRNRDSTLQPDCPLELPPPRTVGHPVVDHGELLPCLQVAQVCHRQIVCSQKVAQSPCVVLFIPSQGGTVAKSQMDSTLKFSEPFIKAEYVEKIVNRRISGSTIVLNVDDEFDVWIEGKPLKPWTSSIFTNVVIPHARKLITINVESDLLSQKPYQYASVLKERWSSVYDIYPLPHYKGIKLWRSERQKINDVAFNLWFAEARTDCGIHKHEQDFGEVHTQVFGIGRMQKFHENDRASIYQEVFMSPGYTHQPFYDDSGNYPWHQYYSDTDCIWLAAEFPL
jgi:hypothetical protein